LVEIRHAVDNFKNAEVVKTLSVRTKFRIISIGVSRGLDFPLPALLGDVELQANCLPDVPGFNPLGQELLSSAVEELIQPGVAENYSREVAKLILHEVEKAALSHCLE